MKKLLLLWLTRQFNKTKFDSTTAFAATQSALIGAQAWMMSPEATQMLESTGSPDWVAFIIKILPTILASVFGVHTTRPLEDAGQGDQVDKKTWLTRILNILPDILESIFVKDPEKQALRRARKADRQAQKAQKKEERQARKNGSG